jgi:hypothetical protein
MSAGKQIGGAAGALLVLLIGLAFGGLIALAPDIAVPAGVLLAPGLAAFLFDPTPARAVARAMLLFQAAAAVRPVAEAWTRCEGMQSCMDMLVRPRLVMMIWAMAAFAWVLTQILPIGLKLLADHRLSLRRAALLGRRETLVADWGLDEH